MAPPSGPRAGDRFNLKQSLSRMASGVCQPSRHVALGEDMTGLGKGEQTAAAQLRAEFESLLAGRDPSTVVHQCGSGVSAVPNLLAMQIAGLGPTALYAGSWSEWSNTPGLPTRQGAQP